MNSVFVNKNGQLHSGWRAAVFLGAFVFLEIAWATLTAFFLSFKPFGIEKGSLFVWAFDLFVSLILAVGLGWACGGTLEGLPLKALGWAIYRGWFRDLIFGSVIGALTLTFACGICVLFGGTSFRWNDQSEPSSIGMTLLIAAAMFLLGAASEESIFRGYLLQTFARAGLAWLAIVITSLIFASAHLANPQTSLLAMVNTILAGVWFSAAYLKTRSLWLPFAAHFAWNWFQGAIFGIPVSGITAVTTAPLLRQVDAGPAWFTGGSYGLEGGVACTVALLLSTALIWFLPLLKADEEMMRLTSKENDTMNNE